MKNQSRWSRYFVFVLVAIFFVLPPIFFSPPASGSQFFSVPNQWKSYAAQISRTFCLVVIFLVFCHQKTNTEKFSVESGISSNKYSSLNAQQPECQKNKKMATQVFWAAATFLALCASATFFEFAGRWLNFPSATVQVALPKTFSEIFLYCTMFLLAAIYEEILYRFYLPKTLEKDCRLRFLSPAAAVLLFALAHRYLGALAVVNAAVSGAVLMFCAKKTRSVVSCVAAHFAYNMVLVIVIGT